MRSLETPPRRLVLLGSLLLLTLSPMGGPPAAFASTAEVLRVGPSPAEPTTCDSVTIEVAGVLSSSCLEIVGAEITGPFPPPPDCAAIVCPARFEIRITVQEPGVPTPCPAVLVPYRRTFPVGVLPAGAYSVRAVEVVVPSVEVSAGFDSTVVSTLFFVRSAPTCPPGPGCFILSFAPSRPLPLPGFCTAVTPPGGSAEFDLLLHNESAVAGVQTSIGIFDPRLDPGSPLPGGTFTPKSVEAVGRAEGFNLEWTAEGSVLRVILFSLTAIPPGDGPILRIVYDVGANTPQGTYFITHFDEVVSDPEGNGLPFCPTFRETGGRLCVVVPGCDVNGDGASDIRDVIRIARCALFGAGTEACPDTVAARSDCNADGTIDVRDVICCARKILAFRLESPAKAAGLPSPGSGTSIDFLGDVEWLTPAEGRVRVRFAPGAQTAGVEWMMWPSVASARPSDLRVVSGGDGVHLEWSTNAAGRAFAMLYSEGGSPIGHDVVLELRVERTFGSSGPGSLHITDPLASGSDGAPELVHSSKAAAVMTATEVPAPAVYPARPNPFVAESEIAFVLPQAARAELRIYDVRGRLVRTLVNEPRAAGVYHERWDGRSDDGRSVASGVYLIRFRAGGTVQTQRLLRLR